MKVLLINYRYFVSGGPERYLFNVKALLEEHGHEVIPFSISYERNEPSPYQSYFAPPLSSPNEVYFRDQSRDVRASLRSLERSIYSPVVYRRLSALIDATRPDAALVLHYLRKLSPSVLKCLATKGVPFAVRLSDFAMVCPNAHLLRGGETCELCVGGAWRHSVRYSCVQGSKAASTVNYVATRIHQAAGYYDLIKKFIVPSRFTIQKMVDGGWSSSRFVHIPTFVRSASSLETGSKSSVPTIAYVGRLEPTKGLDVLLGAAEILERAAPRQEFELQIVGDGEPRYVDSLRRYASDRNLRSVRFAGSRSQEDVATLLSRSWCSVVPSIWYENMPNSALESMSQGTAVIASDHGSLPEIIRQDETGWLTPPGDRQALAQALGKIIGARPVVESVGTAAHAYVRRHHSPEAHYHDLMDTFTELQASPN